MLFNEDKKYSSSIKYGEIKNSFYNTFKDYDPFLITKVYNIDDKFDIKWE